MSGVPIASLVGKVEKWDPRASSADEEIQYIDLSSVDKDAKSITGVQTVLAHSAPSRARQLVRAGDVLVSTVRPNLNGVAVVPDELDGATASTGFCVLRPRPKKLCGRYLFHWVKTPHFVAEMERQATGASYPAVSDKIVKASVLPPHAVDEQKRIAAILDKADAIRRKRKEAIRLTEELLKSVFLEMFGDPVTNPKGWDVKPLGELVQATQLGLVRSTSQQGPDRPYPYVRMNSIRGDGSLHLKDLVRVDAEGKELESGVLRDGDFLFNTRNTRELVGKSAVFWGGPESVPYTFNNNIMRVRFTGSANPDYVAAYFQTHEAQKQLERMKSGTTSVFAIYYKNLKTLGVVLPPRSEQERYATFCKAQRAAISRHQAWLQESDDLYSALSQQFFAPDGASKQEAA